MSHLFIPLKTHFASAAIPSNAFALHMFIRISIAIGPNINPNTPYSLVPAYIPIRDARNTIRGAAVAIAVAFQWIFNFIVSSTFLPMYNMRLGEMGDKFGHMFAYALYGIICVAAALFVWKLVPETKGKTLEDMTKLWKKKK